MICNHTASNIFNSRTLPPQHPRLTNTAVTGEQPYLPVLSTFTTPTPLPSIDDDHAPVCPRPPTVCVTPVAHHHRVDHHRIDHHTQRVRTPASTIPSKLFFLFLCTHLRPRKYFFCLVFLDTNPRRTHTQPIRTPACPRPPLHRYVFVFVFPARRHTRHPSSCSRFMATMPSIGWPSLSVSSRMATPTIDDDDGYPASMTTTTTLPQRRRPWLPLMTAAAPRRWVFLVFFLVVTSPYLLVLCTHYTF